MLITTPLAGLFELLFPILLAVWFIRRYHTSWKLVLFGALGFIGAQVLHIPLLNWLTGQFTSGAIPTPPPAYHVLFNAVLLGLLAGLFEETARVVVYALLRERARTWKEGVTLGIGHGGVESVLLAGLPVLGTYILFMVLRQNPHAVELPLPLQMQFSTYFTMSWDLPLAGAVERLGALITQIALSLIVLQAFLRHNALFYILAVLWHAVIDMVAVLLSGAGLGVWPIELALLFLALINMGIILLLRPRPGTAVVETRE